MEELRRDTRATVGILWLVFLTWAPGRSSLDMIALESEATYVRLSIFLPKHVQSFQVLLHLEHSALSPVE